MIFFVLSILFGVALIVTVLWEAFETIILPRRVRRRFRFTRLFYRGTWIPWSRAAHVIRSKQRKETLLSFFGPLSLIGLLALWAACLVLGFALLHSGLGSHVRAAVDGLPPIIPPGVVVCAKTRAATGSAQLQLNIALRSRVWRPRQVGLAWEVEQTSPQSEVMTHIGRLRGFRVKILGFGR